MAFTPELVRLIIGVAPLDVCFFILPVPRLSENDVALVDPRAILHSAGDSTQSLFAVHTAEADVVATEMLCHHGEHFVIGGHSEVPTPGFFAHTGCRTHACISDWRRCDRAARTRNQPTRERSVQLRGICPSSMDALRFEEAPEQLSPIVIVATIALIGVFVVGFVYQAIGLVV